MNIGTNRNRTCELGKLFKAVDVWLVIAICWSCSYESKTWFLMCWSLFHLPTKLSHELQAQSQDNFSSIHVLHRWFVIERASIFYGVLTVLWVMTFNLFIEVWAIWCGRDIRPAFSKSKWGVLDDCSGPHWVKNSFNNSVSESELFLLTKTGSSRISKRLSLCRLVYEIDQKAAVILIEQV